jgi:hypothetical protein
VALWSLDKPTPGRERDLVGAEGANVAIRRIILGALTAVVGAVASARAQTTGASTGVVAGTVTDQRGTPLADADVIVAGRDSTRLHARSGERGQFRISGVTGPEVTLRVRHLGFAAKTVVVRVLESPQTTSVFVELEARAAALDPVVVGDDSVPGVPDRQLEAFLERARTNHFGHFVTQDDLDRQRPNYVSEALRRIPGVQLQATRAGNIVRLRGCAIQGKSSARVSPAVWVDGVRVESAELDEVAPAANVAGIEIYNSFAGVPPRYLDRTATCGTILVWLRLK